MAKIGTLQEVYDEFVKRKTTPQEEITKQDETSEEVPEVVEEDASPEPEEDKKPLFEAINTLIPSFRSVTISEEGILVLHSESTAIPSLSIDLAKSDFQLLQ